MVTRVVRIVTSFDTDYSMFVQSIDCVAEYQAVVLIEKMDCLLD